ncbi:MAG TPA: serpin family protein [Candidatus Angelobacter sp.]|nr:serpin family protein [Candidatus Angelobacter sp.]
MRRSRKYLRLGVIVMLVAVAVLGFGFWRADKPVDPALIAQAKDASAAMNGMGLKMVAALSARRPRQNVFISPLSIFMALAMTESGAGGATRDAMRQALAVPPGLSDDQLRGSASALMKVLQAERGAELLIANGLWSDSSMPMSQDFVKRCNTFYQADVTSLDFQKPAAASEIEKWVKEKTHGKISGLISPDALLNTRALLTNAVYFHGKWAHQFPKNETAPQSFHLATGGVKKVQMMHQGSLSGAYRQGDGFEAAALDYRESHIRLYAILPSKGSSPEQALAKISMDKLKASAGHVELDLRMPRFTLDYKEELKDTLSGMGMDAAFQSGADFAPMGSPGFFIGGVVHKTRLEVDEEGTTAAAATGVAMLASVPRVKTLVFDRPFALLLCDTQTNAVLFAGVVYEPGP